MPPDPSGQVGLYGPTQVICLGDQRDPPPVDPWMVDRIVVDWFRAIPAALGEGRASRVVLGRLGGFLFIGAGIVVALTAPLVDHGAVPVLVAAGVVAAGIGAIALVLPWDEWRDEALLSQTVIGLVLIAGTARASGALDHYLPMFVVVFVFVGLTQPSRMLLWVVPGAVLAFLIGAGGLADGRTSVNFLVTLVVALTVGLILSFFVSRSAATADSMERLLLVSRALIRSRTVVETVTLLESSTNAILGADLVFTFLADPATPSRFETVLPTAVGLPERLVLDLSVEHSATESVLELDEPIFAPDARNDPRLSRRLVELLSCESVLLVPVGSGTSRLGVLAFCWRTPIRTLSPWASRSVALISGEAGIMISRLRTGEQVETDAATDPLTGLLNRRSMENEVRTLLQHGESLAVVIADLDHFKVLNDTFGHDAGDRALRLFARVLRRTVRESDLVCRYGGEEFIVVCPSADKHTARFLFDRVRLELEAALSDGRNPSFTVSAGVADSGDAADFTDMISLADVALMQAKADGRNRTIEVASVA